MNRFLSDLRIKPLPLRGAIDTGAEEELFRRVGYQAVTEVLAQRWAEADGAVIMQCGECGETMKPLGKRGKEVRTICGTIVIKRLKYYCRKCERTSAPLDERLGIDQTGITPGLMRMACRTALELPYRQSESILSDILGFQPCSARQIERIANLHGAILEEQIKADLTKSMAKPTPIRVPKYCLAIDAAMIAGLPDPVKHRLNWHDVKVAVGFDPSDIDPPFYVAGRESSESFGKRLWHYMESHKLDKDDFLLILGDGAHWIWALADLLFPGVPQLLDFYHAAEHLYATASAIYPQTAAQRWWHKRMAQLKSGEVKAFFQALERLARTYPSDPDDQQSPARLLDYFVSNQSRLDYPWALRNKLPIGSGAVESACRHIPQQRLKLSGMRWSDPGAQSILNLRTLHRNGEFEQYWEQVAVGY